MKHFVKITPDGRFSLNGKRWMCNSTIYFGRYPGTCQANWMDDRYWPKNEKELDRDFELMAQMGLNHTAVFFNHDAFFDNGRVIAKGMDRMDRVIATAKQAGLRVTIFCGRPFIDSPAIYRQVTGRQWEHDNRWLPSFNPALHEAYVMQTAPFARRYRNESTVLAYTDRIDRFHKGFDNLTIPFNLKEEWAGWLKERYGSFQELLRSAGGALEGNPRDFNEVLLPQESRFNASLKNPLAYDYILMQKSTIGDAQARFDAAINRLAPNQFVWTNFESNTVTWAMLDGFTPKTRKLQAVWMEYYFFEVTRPSYVQPFEEWSHTREVCHRRLAHELPVVYTAAYTMARYLKLSTRVPVVVNHGAFMDQRAYGVETEEQQAAIFDRVNAACLAADADGWHYWCWSDDDSSLAAHRAKAKANPTDFYFHGESCGILDFEGHPRPVAAVVARYSRECARRAAARLPAKKSDVLLLSAAPRMYNLFRRMALPTTAAMTGALVRLGVEPDVLWSAQDDVKIKSATLARYKFVVIADNMYERDFTDVPELLLNYVHQGGVLYFAMDRYDSFKDEHGVKHDNAALTRLTGVDPKGWKKWPGHNTVCKNWPFPTKASQEANLDAQAFPRVAWGVCPAFRHCVPYPEKLTLLGFRSTDDDTFTPVPGLLKGAEVVAVAKFPAGTRPFIYRHRIGKGTVYVNAWTNNIFRDSESRQDYGGWEFDWVLDIPLMASRARDVDLTRGASLWLRNSWGYFWKQM